METNMKTVRITTKVLLGVLAVVVVGVTAFFLSNGGLFKGSIFSSGLKVVLNAPTSVSEQGNNSATITMSTASGLSSPDDISATVAFTETSGGTPYTVSGDTNLLIPGGSATSNLVTLTVADNATPTNPDAKITVTLNEVTGASVVFGNTRAITILDSEDDPAATVTLSVDNSNLLEDATPNSAKITATLSQAFNDRNCTVSVPVSFSGDDASDYTLQSTNNPSDPATIKFIAGPATSNFLTLTAKNDATAEGLKTITATMGTPVKTCADVQSNLTVGTPSSIAVNITDDEDNPAKVISFGIGTPVIYEPGQGTPNKGSFAVVLNHPLYAHDITIPVTFTGNAVKGVDYSPDSDSIKIPKGQTTGSLAVNVLSDSFHAEYDETITGTINGGATPNYVVVPSFSQTFTVKGDAPKVTVTMPAGDMVENMTSSKKDYVLSVVPTSASAITANFSLSGLATSGTDYKITSDSAGSNLISVSNNKFTVSIPANSSTAHFYLFTKDDTTYENSENVKVNFDSVTGGGAVLQSMSGSFNITDMEDKPTISVKLNNTSDAGASIYEPHLNRTPNSVNLNLALNKTSNVSGSVILQFTGGATPALFNLSVNGTPKTLTSDGKLTVTFSPSAMPVITLKANDESNPNPVLRTLDALVKVDSSTGATADAASKSVTIFRK